MNTLSRTNSEFNDYASFIETLTPIEAPFKEAIDLLHHTIIENNLVKFKAEYKRLCDLYIKKSTELILEIQQLCLLAYQLNRSTILNFLLDDPDIDINFVDENHNTLLLLAIKNQNNHIAKELIAHPNINLNHCNKQQESALNLALNDVNVELICKLLSYKKLDPNLPDREGFNAIELLSRYNFFSELGISTESIQNITSTLLTNPYFF
jgi:ankyrin repeat protein